jgi:hypothetical protein
VAPPSEDDSDSEKSFDPTKESFWNRMVRDKVASAAASANLADLHADSRLHLFRDFHTEIQNANWPKNDESSSEEDCSGIFGDDSSSSDWFDYEERGFFAKHRATTRELRSWLDSIPSFSPARRTIACKTQLRSGVHFLALHQGRLQDLKREQRICPVCSHGRSKPVETEMHFLLECPAPAFSTARRTAFDELYGDLVALENGATEAFKFITEGEDMRLRKLLFPDTIDFPSTEIRQCFEKVGRELASTLKKQRRKILDEGG